MSLLISTWVDNSHYFEAKVMYIYLSYLIIACICIKVGGIWKLLYSILTDTAFNFTILLMITNGSYICCSGSAELIEKHCSYLCNALSLNIRRLHRHPTSPSVLSSVLIYSQSTILPYIEQIIVEVAVFLFSVLIIKH